MSKLIDTITALQAQNTDLETRLAKLESTQPPSGDVAGEITALQAQTTALATQQAALQTEIDNIDNLTPDAAPAVPVTPPTA